MSIAQMVSGAGINGAIRHCYELSWELAELGHRVTLIHRPGAWIAKQPPHDNIELLESTLRRNWNELRRIAYAIKERKCDVLHTHQSSAHFFGVLIARLFGLRSVATCHMPHFQPHWWWNDRVIVGSQSSMRWQRWFNGVPKNRIDIIPNFINPNKLNSSLDRQTMRKEFGIRNDQFMIAVIGSVNDRKGLDYLLKAIPIVQAEGIDPIVLSAGPIEEKFFRKLIKISKELNISEQVKFLGLRSDIANILEASDCVCLPSKREVMPISLLEAMGFGVPVVATRVGGVPECIRDGIDGYLVPPKDPKSLASALVQLANDVAGRRNMGENARQSMLNDFGPKTLVPRLLDSYRVAASSHSMIQNQARAA